MVNMNLSTEQATGSSQHRSTSSMGLIVITAVFVLVAAATGGLMMWKKILEKQVVESDAVYQQKYDQLIKGDRSKDVVDFQNRIAMANDLIKERNIALDSLQFVEKNIVSGVYLESYKNDKKKKTLVVEGVAENLDAIARQTVSFKSSELFSVVDVTKVGLSPEGKTIFSMEIKIN